MILNHFNVHMRILAVGDIVGKVGMETLKEKLPMLVKDNYIDFIIVNAENAADGFGLTEKMFKEILALNVDCITMGNHTWAKKDIFGFIDNKHIIRPANYSEGNPGRGYEVYESKGKKILVISLIGRVTMPVLSDNPFTEAKKIIKEKKKDVDIIIIDFHGEATAEKAALAHYLDGEVNIVFGTHTHVQTADERVLEKGTAFITDIGMTGPKNSIIGMDIEVSFKRFLTSIPEKYKSAEGEGILNAVLFDLDNEDYRVREIKRVIC